MFPEMYRGECVDYNWYYAFRPLAPTLKDLKDFQQTGNKIFESKKTTYTTKEQKKIKQETKTKNISFEQSTLTHFLFLTFICLGHSQRFFFANVFIAVSPNFCLENGCSSPSGPVYFSKSFSYVSSSNRGRFTVQNKPLPPYKFALTVMPPSGIRYLPLPLQSTFSLSILEIFTV